MEDSSTKNKRIARNTLILYVRTFITLIVSLYTSRIVLSALGVDNYGVYNVVGGLVAMFGIISGPISGAISRFLTYELGRGNSEKLQTVFSTAINAMLLLGGIVVVLCEIIGVWFLNHKLNIPPESTYAANWVLQCSIFSMVLGLVNMPYSAAIISHERMDVYAYMAILDVMLKLALAFFIQITPFNVLITYAVGLLLIFAIDRIIYQIYCVRKFPECRYIAILDKPVFKKMTGFAMWSFLGNFTTVCNTQGAAMLMNIFFGVVVNTAKGIAAQVEAAVMSFVNTFTTAFSPQIIKSYAEGNLAYMYSLMERGSKFSVYLMLFFLIPIEFEAEMVLNLWLGNVPEYSTSFLRLSLICTTLLLLGGPYYTGICAQGDIKNYQLTTTSIALLGLPLTYVLYRLKFSVTSFYAVFIAVYFTIILVRMIFIQKQLGYRFSAFILRVLCPIFATAGLSLIVPAIICQYMTDSILRLCLVTLASVASTAAIVYCVGVNKSERNYFNKIILKILHIKSR